MKHAFGKGIDRPNPGAPQAKRLLELMMAVNRKRTFTVKELAQEFAVSTRTILRDLQELSAMGVPLYSEVGPHGGYRVLNERMLPPISFTEDEAVSIFFAVHALRHFRSIPFRAESSSALRKFYYHMPPDIRERIDQMKKRVDFLTPARGVNAPFLSDLLDAAVKQQVLRITYESRDRRAEREIQPIGIYSRNGLWYCLAYCFEQGHFRVFRCGRMKALATSPTTPLDLRHIHLENREAFRSEQQEAVQLYAELTKSGVESCEAAPWPEPRLFVRGDGTGWLEGKIAKDDIPYFAMFFIGLGHDVDVVNPPELIACIKQKLAELTAKYAQ